MRRRRSVRKGHGRRLSANRSTSSRDDRPAAADAVLLHQDRQPIALLVNKVSCWPKPKNASPATTRGATGRGRAARRPAPSRRRRSADASRSSPRRSVGSSPRLRRPTGAPRNWRASGRCRTSRPAAPVARRHGVANVERAFGRAECAHLGGRFFGGEEIPVRRGFPEDALRRAPMRNLNAAAYAPDEKVADRALIDRPLGRRRRRGRKRRGRRARGGESEEFAPLHRTRPRRSAIVEPIRRIWFSSGDCLDRRGRNRRQLEGRLDAVEA